MPILVKGGCISNQNLELPPDGIYYTYEELSKEWGVTKTLLRVWGKRGVIKKYNINGRAYVPECKFPGKRSPGRPCKKVTNPEKM